VEGFRVAANDRTYKSARRLRKEMSLPEVLLWRLLRRSQPPIRRQHPLGDYVLDFYCAAAKLVFEVDGFAHQTGDRPQRDERRQHWLEARGLRVMRIDARDVLRDPESCADAILRLCEEKITPPPQR
jgi:very-short-patch-repair endonuclease